MFKKILIANRGEIACRVIRTAKSLGIRCVAIYSDSDQNARHVAMADESYHIGPAPSQESYLQANKIIAVAKRCKAEAIHPGYGFLSENAEFAELCAQASIIFIGPPPAALRAMAAKDKAKQIMAQAKVPLIPGYHDDDQSPATLAKQADNIGYPVLIKAALGGGGKGMRIVTQKKDFNDALAGAKREAKASFGNDRVIIEKYVTQPRHIEIQVFADTHGNVIHLFERDCSIQRRHQKIIEEAPAPGMTKQLREQMGAAAVNAARAIDYVGAGTIEFLLAPDQQFYFMEMNTRLQVEHPVTEMITGQDLVAWQLQVAAGMPLPLSQKDLKITGHAFETRIYAEDPYHDFLPSIGHIKHLRRPQTSDHVRIDTGIREGDQISMYYDPMIAKLIVWDQDRNSALTRLQKALAEYQIVGVKTNLSLLQTIAKLPEFSKYQLTTQFIDQHQQQLLTPPQQNIYEVLALASLYTLLVNRQQQHLQAQQNADPFSPWFFADAWQLNLAHQQQLQFNLADQHYQVQIRHYPDHFELLIPEAGSTQLQKFCVSGELQLATHELIAIINDKRINATVIPNHHEYNLFYAGQQHQVMLQTASDLYEQEQTSGGQLLAPMPGTVVAILTKVGDTVTEGNALMVIEAMKMEHTIYAPSSGVIKALPFQVGDRVDEGTELLEFAQESE